MIGTILAVLIVATAALYWLRRLLPARLMPGKKPVPAGGCGGCSGCGSKTGSCH